MSSEKHRKIEVGRILGAHGVRGLVKLASYTEDPAALFTYKPLTDESGVRLFDVMQRGAGPSGFIAAIEGVTDRDAAEALRGVVLFADRAALPPVQEGEYYLADLIGLAAQDGAGKRIGKIEAVHDYGAGVFLEIKPPKGGSFMLPFKDAFVPAVDLEAGLATLIVPDGWCDDRQKEKEPTREK